MRFPTMWYVRPAKPQMRSLLVALLFYDSWATDRTTFKVSKLKRRLTCQNTTLLEITRHGSNVFVEKRNSVNSCNYHLQVDII